MRKFKTTIVKHNKPLDLSPVWQKLADDIKGGKIIIEQKIDCGRQVKETFKKEVNK